MFDTVRELAFNKANKGFLLTKLKSLGVIECTSKRNSRFKKSCARLHEALGPIQLCYITQQIFFLKLLLQKVVIIKVIKTFLLGLLNLLA